MIVHTIARKRTSRLVQCIADFMVQGSNWAYHLDDCRTIGMITQRTGNDHTMCSSNPKLKMSDMGRHAPSTASGAECNRAPAPKSKRPHGAMETICSHDLCEFRFSLLICS